MFWVTTQPTGTAPVLNEQDALDNKSGVPSLLESIKISTFSGSLFEAEGAPGCFVSPTVVAIDCTEPDGYSVDRPKGKVMLSYVLLLVIAHKFDGVNRAANAVCVDKQTEIKKTAKQLRLITSYPNESILKTCTNCSGQQLNAASYMPVNKKRRYSNG